MVLVAVALLAISTLFVHAFQVPPTGSLEKMLNHYEIVDVRTSMGHRMYKRSAEHSRANHVDSFSFCAFNREFRARLFSSLGILYPSFQALSVDGFGRRNRELVDLSGFYHGKLDDDPLSTVSAEIDENGAVTASIATSSEVYFVEPAWRHLLNISSSISIAYRASDLIANGDPLPTRFCGVEPSGVPNSTDHVISKRQSTQSTPWTGKNRCSLKLVADYRFHRDVGGSRVATTIRYLISLIDRVNSIYTQTIWRDSETEGGFENVGFVIKKIVVHTAPTESIGHYNAYATKWEVGHLLQRFSELEGSKDFCLVHLFTAQSFSGGVLGLGYIASPKLGTSGGICSTGIMVRKKLVYFNTALTSVRSSYGGPVITREADIVTAHEFGHNWGSPHDPVSDECSPPSDAGGPYIMFTYSVSGYDLNNKIFSPCSRRSIKAVLQAKSQLCFVEEENTFCGNQRVEPGEDCDVSLLQHGEEDVCCSADCKFKPNAVCSPVNSPCCSASCQFLSKGTVCRQSDLNSCKLKSFCDGANADCPPPLPVADGTPCMDGGECQNGECVSFCERHDIGMKPCICENQTLSCLRCCRPANSNICTPFSRLPNYRVPKVLADGTRCIHGYCVDGKCKREVQDLVEHIWDIIDKLDINAILKFMKNNIVSTVALSTLILWIPASLLVNSIDREKSLQRNREVNWMFSDNLVDNAQRIRVVRGVRHLTGGHSVTDKH
uniref:Disintegrin domain-containing protein n=1 Tax=Trichuris muris TaxID=70415 RepID=A0A5S6QVI5_TRIMR